MNKQPEVTAQTRKNLVMAFCALYEDRSIEKITVKDVVTSAGYNRSTFYEYFADIYELLRFIEDDVIDYIRGKLKTEQRSQKNLLSLFAAKEDYLKVLLGTYGCGHFQDRLRTELLRDIASAESGGKLSPYLTEFHMLVSLSMYRLWLQRGKDISLDELSALIHALYTSGVSAAAQLDKQK